jgi:hypothetical protein
MVSETIKNWLTKNYKTVIALGGVFALYKIVKYFSGEDTKPVKKEESNKSNISGFTKEMKYPKLMSEILKGESGGYNDHNYYKGGSLGGYVEGKYGKKYSALTKNLTDYTLGQVIGFQNNSRSSNYGQLWAVGRYQIIPTTLTGTYKSAGLKLTDKFSAANQDKLAMALLKGRPNLWKYLTKQVDDSLTNKYSAALDIAKTWSSVGVPYPNVSFWGLPILKNDSFYSPKDKATTKTENIQKLLKESRTA